VIQPTPFELQQAQRQKDRIQRQTLQSIRDSLLALEKYLNQLAVDYMRRKRNEKRA
jgi:hypothetical protein